MFRLYNLAAAVNVKESPNSLSLRIRVKYASILGVRSSSVRPTSGDDKKGL